MCYVRSILTIDTAGRPVLCLVWSILSIYTAGVTCSVSCSEHFYLLILQVDLFFASLGAF